MAAPQVKRRFQPSITSYFAYGDLDRPRPRPVDSTSPSNPLLPAAIQSSLLNVGMRVRKSVVDGYKTKSHTRTEPQPSARSDERLAIHSNRPTTVSEGSGMGLVPYCGILKVGGYAQQPTFEDETTTVSFDSSHFEFPASSQDSNTSTITTDSMPATVPIYDSLNHKRRYEESNEEGNEYQAGYVHVHEDSDIPFSIHSNSFGHSEYQPMLGPGRPFAHPKSRKKAIDGPLAIGMGVGDVENAPHSETAEIVDFEEASFLQPCQEEYEVQMGGL